MSDIDNVICISSLTPNSRFSKEEVSGAIKNFLEVHGPSDSPTFICDIATYVLALSNKLLDINDDLPSRSQIAYLPKKIILRAVLYCAVIDQYFDVSKNFLISELSFEELRSFVYACEIIYTLLG